MKLVMDCENEHFEMECKAAYVVIMDPEDSSADMALAVMGKSSYHKLLCAIARTLDSFIRTLSEGNELTRKSLWKDFKNAYKNAKFMGTTKIERKEERPVEEE